MLIGTVLLVGALLWLAEAFGGRTTTMYTAYFRTQSLAGLQQESAVTMKGVKVGKVESYQISPRNIEEVKVLLRLDEDTPVKEDTRVVLQRNLLTGFATLGLVDSTQNSPPLKAVLPGEDYPVIQEGESQFDKIADTVPALLDHINEMVGRVTLVFSDENVKSVTATLKHIEETAAAVSSNKESIAASLESLEQLAAEITSLSEALKGFTRKAEKNLDSLGSESARVLEEVRDAAKNFDARVTEIRDAVRGASQVFSQEMTALAQSMGAAADTFAKTVEGFEDPQKIIAGPRRQALGPGEQIEQ